MKRKSTEDFINEMKIKQPNIEIQGDYINNKTPIKCNCCICGNVWNPRPDQLVRGQGCPICGYKKRIKSQTKSHEQFVKEIKLINPQIEIIGKYVNNHTLINVKCLNCGKEWGATPNNLLRNHGCLNCNGQFLKSQCQYEEDMRNTHPNIKVIGKYMNNKTQAEVLCEKCGNVWNSYPINAIYKNHGCPRCEKKYKGEVKISNYFNNNDINYESQKSYEDLFGVGGRKLRYDFYLPDFDLLIEYQGNFHDGSSFVGDFFTKERLEIQQEHDERKRKYAKKHNIKLLEIWYWDFDNIEKILNNNIKGETKL